jgi:hypothetical protein
MDVDERMARLRGNIDLTQDPATLSPRQLREISDRIVEAVDKILAQGPEKEDDVYRLLARVMITVQPLIIAQYGDTSPESIRKFIFDQISKVSKTGVRSDRESLEAAMVERGTPEEEKQLVRGVYPYFLSCLTEEIIGLLEHTRFLPRQNIPQIVDVLVQMLKEDANAHRS